MSNWVKLKNIFQKQVEKCSFHFPLHINFHDSLSSSCSSGHQSVFIYFSVPRNLLIPSRVPCSPLKVILSVSLNVVLYVDLEMSLCEHGASRVLRYQQHSQTMVPQFSRRTAPCDNTPLPCAYTYTHTHAAYTNTQLYHN